MEDYKRRVLLPKAVTLHNLPVEISLMFGLISLKIYYFATFLSSRPLSVLPLLLKQTSVIM